ncbi:hypothetical protein CBW22_03010 [Pantoea sp. VS1]|uniref:hypothetical protein n=1 Tax=Pantoea sp. VS1 TaxID=2003658 RepID=UPI000B508AF6|nr:hypothetical protein [Pantoea sp. VS1]OWS77107.1 hypothetical protein CBW22_03010 [Pantoea sp. VS1]
MNGCLIAETLENTPPRQWFVYGAMLITVAFALLRTAGNLREIYRLRQFGKLRARYYAVRVWGVSSEPLRIFLVAECLVVDALCALLVLSDVTLW